MTAHRVVFEDVLIIDGSGNEPYPGVVEIAGDRIVRVEAVCAGSRDRADDASTPRRAIAPGFIDVHSHADLSPLTLGTPHPDISKISQGITTEVVGNCGSSTAPAPSGIRSTSQMLAASLFPDTELRWRSFGEWCEVIGAGGTLTNLVPLVGHGALRGAAAGARPGSLSVEENRMTRLLLEEALEAGAFGLSSGLIYSPSMNADTSELRELVRLLPPNAVYATHMRNEADRLLQSVDEALATVEGAEARLHVSHLKAAGRQNWPLAPRALAALRAARTRGVRVTQDIYPYTAASTTLSACLPPWAQNLVNTGGGAALRDSEVRREILATLGPDLRIEGWENILAGASYSDIAISYTPTGEYQGLTLQQIADGTDRDPHEVLYSLVAEHGTQVAMLEFSMSEESIAEILADPFTAVGTDGLPYRSDDLPHPRRAGSFPRVLRRFVREEGVLTLAEAVHRMTGLSAEIFGLTDRGRIVPGYAADLVLFDPETIADGASYETPRAEPAGVHEVYVNGRCAYQGSAWTGERSGRLLTRDPA